MHRLRWLLPGALLIPGLVLLSVIIPAGAQGDTQTFMTEDNTFSFEYPADLVIAADSTVGQILLGTDESALLLTETPPAGTVKLTIYVPGRSPDLPDAYQTPGTAAPGGPEEVLTAVIEGRSDLTFGRIRVLDLDGRPVALADFESPVNGFYAVMDAGEGAYLTLEALVHPDDMFDQRRDVVQTILRSVRYAPEGLSALPTATQEVLATDTAEPDTGMPGAVSTESPPISTPDTQPPAVGTSTPEIGTPDMQPPAVGTGTPQIGTPTVDAGTPAAGTPVTTAVVTAVVTEAPVASPTGTPAVPSTPTATFAPVGDELLAVVPEVYSSPGDVLRLNHPQGWTVSAEQGVLTLTAGELYLQTVGLSAPFEITLDMAFNAAQFAPAAGPEPVLRAYSNSATTTGGDAPLTLGDPERARFGDYPGALARGTLNEEGLLFDAMAVMVQYAPQGYYLMSVTTAPAQLERIEAVVFAIADSLRYREDYAMVETGVYNTGDERFSFAFPSEWQVHNRLGYITLNPATVGNAEVLVLMPPAADDDYQQILTAATTLEDLATALTGYFTPDGATVTDTVPVSYAPFGRNPGLKASFTYEPDAAIAVPQTVVLHIVDLGGGIWIPVVLRGEQQQVTALLDTANTVASTFYNRDAGPVVSLPPGQQPQPPTQQPPPGGATAVPATPGGPPPTVAPPSRPEIQPVTGQVGLYYGNGTLTLYNGSGEILDLGDMAFVSPDGSRRFISRDFGLLMTEYLQPRRCIHVYLLSQGYSPPTFCNDIITRELGYIHADVQYLYPVWDASRGNTAFQVIRDEQVIANCTVSAGQCTFDVPASILPRIPEWP